MKNRVLIMISLLVLAFTQSAYAYWTWTEGSDGVRIYYPATGWTWTEGSDGRRVVYPVDGWTWTEGRNKRRVIYPVDGWTWSEGTDGRRVVYPTNGWTWTQGRDGVRVIYPLDGWTWTEGRDGHRIVYPTSGWTWREDPSGRRVAYQISGDPYLRAEDLLYNLLVGRMPITKELHPFSYLLIEQMGIEYPGGIYDYELRRAHTMLNMNDYYGARDQFRKIAQTGSTDEIRRDASYYVGYCTAQLQDYWQAISEFSDFLIQYDQSWNTRLIPEALYTSGILHEYIGRTSDAANFYRKCISRFSHTQMAVQSQERLNALGRTYRQFADDRTSFETAADDDYAASRRNPLFNKKPNSAQIARVCQFIYAVDRMSDVEDALSKLTPADKQLLTVKNYLKILSDKRQFEGLHQGLEN